VTSRSGDDPPFEFANFTAWFKEQFGSEPSCPAYDEVLAAEGHARALRLRFEANLTWLAKHDAALKAVVAAPSILSLHKEKTK